MSKPNKGSDVKPLTEADIDKAVSETLDHCPEYQSFLQSFGLKGLRDKIRESQKALDKTQK